MKPNDLSVMHANAAQAEHLLALLANRHRLLILCQLTESELTVSKLVDASAISQSAVSQHLAKLRDANVVATRREGQTIFYRLASDEVKAIIETLCGLYLPTSNT